MPKKKPPKLPKKQHKPFSLSEKDKEVWEQFTQEDIIPPADLIVKKTVSAYSSVSKANTSTPLEKNVMRGVDKRTAEKVKKGLYPIDAEIDLHGMSQKDARIALENFITRSYNNKKRCVMVIIGKGKYDIKAKEASYKGVLRNELPNWLNTSPLREKILYFTTARPEDGGEGAVYILLKKHKD